MKNHLFIYWGTILVLAAATGVSAQQAPACSHIGSDFELPEIRIVVNMEADYTDPEDPDRHEKVRVKEAELALQGHPYPGIRGDFVAAFEQQYHDSESSTETHVEEAYVTFLDLPADLQAVMGRKFIGFGRLNAIHPHHWAFTQTPLVLDNLFGEHPWYDDGVLASIQVPHPAECDIKASAGVWNGRSLEHSHGDEEDADHNHESEADHEDHEEHEYDHEDHPLVEWDDHVFTGRVSAGFPFSETLDAQLGCSIAADQGQRNQLYGVDLVVGFRETGSARKARWHTEAFFMDDGERGTSPFGLFSYVTYAPNPYWEYGGMYDFTELLEDDGENAWAGSGFVTRYLTHATYLRVQYRYTEFSDDAYEAEHLASMQLVWGIGPHAHHMDD